MKERDELVIDCGRYPLRAPKWLCAKHGKIDGSDVVTVFHPGRPGKCFCLHCVLELLERLGLEAVPRVE